MGREPQPLLLCLGPKRKRRGKNHTQHWTGGDVSKPLLLPLTFPWAATISFNRQDKEVCVLHLATAHLIKNKQCWMQQVCLLKTRRKQNGLVTGLKKKKKKEQNRKTQHEKLYLVSMHIIQSKQTLLLSFFFFFLHFTYRSVSQIFT